MESKLKVIESRLEVGTKVYNWADGPLTIEKVDGDYIEVIVDDQENIRYQPKDNFSARLLTQKNKSYNIKQINEWIFLSPERVGCIPLEITPERLKDNLHGFFDVEKVLKERATTPKQRALAGYEGQRQVLQVELDKKKAELDTIVSSEKAGQGRLEACENDISKLEAIIAKAKKDIQAMNSEQSPALLKENMEKIERLTKEKKEATAQLAKVPKVKELAQGQLTELTNKKKMVEDEISRLEKEITSLDKKMKQLL